MLAVVPRKVCILNVLYNITNDLCVKYLNCEYDIGHIKRNLACAIASRYLF